MKDREVSHGVDAFLMLIDIVFYLEIKPDDIGLLGKDERADVRTSQWMLDILGWSIAIFVKDTANRVGM